MIEYRAIYALRCPRGKYISEIKIENFRLFGSGDSAFVLRLKLGLTAIVGENDAGKTAVIDAIRFVLGTRDQEMLRLAVIIPSTGNLNQTSRRNLSAALRVVSETHIPE